MTEDSFSSPSVKKQVAELSAFSDADTSRQSNPKRAKKTEDIM